MDIKSLEMVKIPLISLQASAEYFRAEANRYAEMGSTMSDMRHWADGMARAYERILETYAK